MTRLVKRSLKNDTPNQKEGSRSQSNQRHQAHDQTRHPDCRQGESPGDGPPTRIDAPFTVAPQHGVSSVPSSSLSVPRLDRPDIDGRRTDIDDRRSKRRRRCRIVRSRRCQRLVGEEDDGHRRSLERDGTSVGAGIAIDGDRLPVSIKPSVTRKRRSEGLVGPVDFVLFGDGRGGKVPG
jgi:hypothetical protein